MASAASDPTHLDPRCLYAFKGFIRSSGINQTRMREARKKGIDLPRIRVGRRVFVRGADAIAYIERLAQL
jgi:hypothetical protein